jgi:hypothetical protein
VPTSRRHSIPKDQKESTDHALDGARRSAPSANAIAQVAVTAAIAAISLTSLTSSISLTSLVWLAAPVRFAPGPPPQAAGRNWDY